MLYGGHWGGRSVQESGGGIILRGVIIYSTKLRASFILYSDPENEHRVVVDLEWSTSKIKAYGNERGWVAVCELASPYHDGEITAAGDSVKDLHEPYIISDDTFYKLVLAASSWGAETTTHYTSPVKHPRGAGTEEDAD